MRAKDLGSPIFQAWCVPGAPSCPYSLGRGYPCWSGLWVIVGNTLASDYPLGGCGAVLKLQRSVGDLIAASAPKRPPDLQL